MKSCSARGNASFEVLFCGLLFAALIFLASATARYFIRSTRSFSTAAASVQNKVMEAKTPCLENVDVADVSKDELGREIWITTEKICN